MRQLDFEDERLLEILLLKEKSHLWWPLECNEYARHAIEKGNHGILLEMIVRLQAVGARVCACLERLQDRRSGFFLCCNSIEEGDGSIRIEEPPGAIEMTHSVECRPMSRCCEERQHVHDRAIDICGFEQ